MTIHPPPRRDPRADVRRSAFNAWLSQAGQIGNASFPPGGAIRGPSGPSTALDPEPTAQADPEPTFMAATRDGRVYRKPTFGKGQVAMAAAWAVAFRTAPLGRPVVLPSNAAA
jgi:hypothetical protein